MAVKDYVCGQCGFRTREIPGVYNCPHCGNQMDVGKFSGGRNRGKLMVYFLLIALLLPGLLMLAGIFGLVAFIIIFILVRMILVRISQNHARIQRDVRFNSRKYVCQSCGHSFKGKELKCPICGVNLRYDRIRRI